MKRSILFAVALAAAPALAAPEIADQALTRARAALARGDGIAADADLQRALAAGASRTDIAASMGQAKLLQGDRGKAREWLGPRQFAPDEQALGWRMVGILERTDGNLPAAGRAFDRALMIAPKDPLLWIEIGRLRFQGGEQLQAIEAADRALSSAPDEPRALQFKAQFVRNAEGGNAAIPFLQRALSRSPDDLSLLGDLAGNLGDAGRYGEMLAVTRHMLALDETNPLAFYLQSVLAARAGDDDLARAMLARTGNRMNTVPAAMLLQGVLELESGNANVAAQILGDLADRQPANVQVQTLLARALYESSDARIGARLGAAAGRADATPYLLLALGRGQEEADDRAKAAPLLDRAAEALAPAFLPATTSTPPPVLAARWREAPGSVFTTSDFVKSLLAANENVQAGTVTDQFLARYPGSATALSLSGDSWLALKKPALAIGAYRAAARVRTSDALTLRTAIAMEQAGQAVQSADYVESRLRIDQASWLITRIAANQAFDRGNPARARDLLEALRDRGGNRDARLLATLALAQLRSGDGDQAVRTAKRAYELSPASGFTAAVYALSAAADGDRATAQQLISFASKLQADQRLLAEAKLKLR